MRLLEISSLVRFIPDYETVHAFGIKLHVSILGIYTAAYGAVILYSGYICRNHGGYAYGSLARNSLTLCTSRNPMPLRDKPAHFWKTRVSGFQWLTLYRQFHWVGLRSEESDLAMSVFKYSKKIFYVNFFK